MVEALGDHDLFASAPSWDGKWMSYLLRTSGFPRHILRLRSIEEAVRETAAEILKPMFSAAQLELEVHKIAARASLIKADPPAHRALPDAVGEYERWLDAKQAARERLQADD